MSWNLTYRDTAADPDQDLKVVVGSCCGIKPSPVPVPGSALLLGSSLLGLVGIGSRRKKA
jgi:hypothetical protein